MTVSGILTPDATGVYLHHGTHNGYWAWQREDHAWWLVLDADGNGAAIQQTPGGEVGPEIPYWTLSMVDTAYRVAGDYTPRGNAQGTAEVRGDEEPGLAATGDGQWPGIQTAVGKLIYRDQYNERPRYATGDFLKRISYHLPAAAWRFTLEPPDGPDNYFDSPTMLGMYTAHGTCLGTPFLEDIYQPYAGADFRVIGDPLPNCTGFYFYAGQYQDKPYYQRQHDEYALWYDGTYYNLSTALTIVDPGYWIAPQPAVVKGQYTPQGTYTGLPTVICVDGCGEDEQDLAQAAYLAWSAAHPEAAARGRPARNAWLKRHGREHHQT